MRNKARDSRTEAYRKHVERVRKIQKVVYKHLKSVREKTIARLGEEDAFRIIEFHANNWIDVVDWMASRYKGEDKGSIVGSHFLLLFRELWWMQHLFLFANYPAISR